MKIKRAEDIEPASQLEADVVIIGAGIVGLAMALRIAEEGRDVLILESGHGRPSKRAQALNDGETTGDKNTDPSRTRMRAFGGTIHQWDIELDGELCGGRFVELDSYDFEGKPDCTESRWPIQREDLEPYYSVAHRELGLGELMGLPQTGAGAFRSESLAFGRFSIADYRLVKNDLHARIEAHSRVSCLLGATVFNIGLEPSGEQATELRVASAPNREFSVRPQVVALANGAIETARLLLLSNKTQPEGIGNAYGNVGRYYMDHGIELGFYAPYIKASDFEKFARFDLHEYKRRRAVGFMNLAEEIRKREKLINVAILLSPQHKWLRASRIAALKNKLRGKSGEFRPYDLLGAVTDVLRLIHGKRREAQAYGTARYGWANLTAKTMESLFDKLQLCCVVEQLPCRENRVTLSEKRDLYDLRQPRVEWQWTERDRAAFEKVALHLRSEFEAMGYPLMGGPSRAGMSGTHHHFGTTRMSIDPKEGVVDPTGRVHGVANLFVGGTATACSSGFVNPTLTGVALGLRTADIMIQN